MKPTEEQQIDDVLGPLAACRVAADMLKDMARCREFGFEPLDVVRAVLLPSIAKAEGRRYADPVTDPDAAKLLAALRAAEPEGVKRVPGALSALVPGVPADRAQEIAEDLQARGEIYHCWDDSSEPEFWRADPPLTGGYPDVGDETPPRPESRRAAPELPARDRGVGGAGPAGRRRAPPPGCAP
jgi:hypothetical protein